MSKSEYVVSVVDDELRDISITKEIVQQPEKFKSPGSGKKKIHLRVPKECRDIIVNLVNIFRKF